MSHSYHTLALVTQRHMCSVTRPPRGTFTGLMSGKKMGNQLNMPGVCYSGWVLRVTSSNRTVSK